MTLKEKYREAKKLLKEGKLTQADEMLDRCLVHLSKLTLQGEKATEGADLNLWKTRVWVTIEKAGLLPE